MQIKIMCEVIKHNESQGRNDILLLISDYLYTSNTCQQNLKPDTVLESPYIRVYITYIDLYVYYY